jgi:hypothetical protein
MEKLGIKKDAYYADLKFLNIKPIRDEEGKVWLTPEDAERIKHLRSYLEENGKRAGYSGIVKTESDSAVANSSSSLAQEDIYVEPEQPTEQFSVNDLIRGAAELKAREVAMPDLVKRAFADQMTEDDLPKDLKEKVKLAREAANPKFTPTEVASQLLNQWRRAKGG